MSMLAKPSRALIGGSARRLELPLESPGRGYFLSALLALGLHASVIFGWQRSPQFEPAEYGVVSGESSIEVALVAVMEDVSTPDEPSKQLAPSPPVETQEILDKVAEQAEPEPTAIPAESPVFNAQQQMPKPERTPQATPERVRTREMSALKPRPVAGRKDHREGSDPLGRSGSNARGSPQTSGSRSSKPAYLYNPLPSYPEAARKTGQRGVVVLRVSINERGRVSAVNLIRSSGHSLLDDRARTAVQRWIFRPARQNGKPVATQVDVPVRFSLDR
jgi:periplasmic protein TonB